MEQYLKHARFILSDDSTVYKPNRTGVDSLSRFGYQSEYDLSRAFPLITTKRMPFKHVAGELLWFMSGETNIQPLVRKGIHIWDRNAFQYWTEKTKATQKYPPYSKEWHQGVEDFAEKIAQDDAFAQEHGSLGEVYGAQWRHFKTRDGKEIDQLSDAIHKIKTTPTSRRIIVSAWNPEDVPAMALPPCHAFMQFNVDPENRKLDCALTQRSCDMFLGVPFNIASYALLTNILAQEANLKPGRFVHSLNDAHFYCGRGERGAWYKEELPMIKQRVKEAKIPSDYKEIRAYIEANAPREKEGEEGLDHVTAILEQLEREPRFLPNVGIAKKPWDKLTLEDITLYNYDPHPSIKRSMAA